MDQFILNKQEFDIDKLASGTEYTDKIFCNKRPDGNFNKDKLQVKHSTFANIGFKQSIIKNSDLSQNVFINCYFKKADIWGVNFTGCKFINCQFDNSVIEHSDFIYASFENCYIEYDTMFGNLPTEFNLREKLCRNLSIECLKIGLDKEYKKYFFEERKSKENHCFEFFRLNTKSYYKNKTSYQRITAFFKYTQSKISKIIWGYGENISQLLVSIMIAISLYSIIYSLCGNVFIYQLNETSGFKLSLFNAFYFSFSNFFTSSSGFYSNNLLVKATIVSQYFVGATFMGCFVAAVYKNINRR